MSVVLSFSITVLEKQKKLSKNVPKFLSIWKLIFVSHYFVTLLNYLCKYLITTNKIKELATLKMLTNVYFLIHLSKPFPNFFVEQSFNKLILDLSNQNIQKKATIILKPQKVLNNHLIDLKELIVWNTYFI